MAEEYERRTKIGLVGTGMVGASFAYAFIQQGHASEMVLIDANHGRAEAEAMDVRCVSGLARMPTSPGPV
jgi:L-lactate dehydrogenase